MWLRQKSYFSRCKLLISFGRKAGLKWLISLTFDISNQEKESWEKTFKIILYPWTLFCNDIGIHCNQLRIPSGHWSEDFTLGNKVSAAFFFHSFTEYFAHYPLSIDMKILLSVTNEANTAAQLYSYCHTVPLVQYSIQQWWFISGLVIFQVHVHFWPMGHLWGLLTAKHITISTSKLSTLAFIKVYSSHST